MTSIYHIYMHKKSKRIEVSMFSPGPEWVRIHSGSFKGMIQLFHQLNNAKKAT